MLTLIQKPNSTGTYLGGKGWIKRLATLPPPPLMEKQKMQN